MKQSKAEKAEEGSSFPQFFEIDVEFFCFFKWLHFSNTAKESQLQASGQAIVDLDLGFQSNDSQKFALHKIRTALITKPNALLQYHSARQDKFAQDPTRVSQKRYEAEAP